MLPASKIACICSRLTILRWSASSTRIPAASAADAEQREKDKPKAEPEGAEKYGYEAESLGIRPKWPRWHTFSLLLLIIAIGVLGSTHRPAFHAA
jgi:hypothetical protein